ncbi:MAG: glycosyltransferase family 2 protein [Clostridia bacterium]|nr:glycosyltransferase family 2 protein [Clostridia bacterium]
MKKLFAFLPCYNEEQNIGPLIEEWMKQKETLTNAGFQLKIIAIDDCSTDHTKEQILQKAKLYPEVLLVAHPINKGLCGGLNTALSYFSVHGKQGDLMALMDGDNTHDPIYIHPMIARIQEGNDCVIASRYREDSAVVGVARHRELMSDMAKIYYTLMLRVPGVRDYTCGYRVYTLRLINRLLERFGNDPIQEKSFACMMELLYRCHLVGADFGEVGFRLRYDFKQGESKMNVFKTMRKSLTTAIKLRFLK